MRDNFVGTIHEIPYVKMEEQFVSVPVSNMSSFNLNPSPPRLGAPAPGQYFPVGQASMGVPQVPYIVQGVPQTAMYAPQPGYPSNTRLAPGEMRMTPGETLRPTQGGARLSLRDKMIKKEKMTRIAIAAIVFLLGLSLIFAVGLLAVKMKKKNALKMGRVVVVREPEAKSKLGNLPKVFSDIKNRAKGPKLSKETKQAQKETKQAQKEAKQAQKKQEKQAKVSRKFALKRAVAETQAFAEPPVEPIF